MLEYYYMYFTATAKNRIKTDANLCKWREFLFNPEIKHINLLCGLLAPKIVYTRGYYINIEKQQIYLVKMILQHFPYLGTKIKRPGIGGFNIY